MISASPIRYTANVDELRRFFEVLGFKPHLAAESREWTELRGGIGMIAIHRADAPSDELSFESDEPLEAVRARLHDAGFADAHLIDEAYGRSLRVTDPDGKLVQINERITDTYGYQVY